MLNLLEAYSLFDWAEFAFEDAATAYFISMQIRLLGAGFTLLAVSSLVQIIFMLRPGQYWTWWLLIPTQLLAAGALGGFLFSLNRLGALEFILIFSSLIGILAWWRIRSILIRICSKQFAITSITRLATIL